MCCDKNKFHFEMVQLNNVFFCLFIVPNVMRHFARITPNHDSKRCHFDIDRNAMHKNANEHHFKCNKLKQTSKENYDWSPKNRLTRLCSTIHFGRKKKISFYLFQFFKGWKKSFSQSFIVLHSIQYLHHHDIVNFIVVIIVVFSCAWYSNIILKSIVKLMKIQFDFSYWKIISWQNRTEKNEKNEPNQPCMVEWTTHCDDAQLNR